jgi:peptidoglycan/xylan/chitin deacetylase (PgdA/CDA1 family)
MTNEQIVAELGWTRKAIQSVLGVTPTTMRPPYGDIGEFHASNPVDTLED